MDTAFDAIATREIIRKHPDGTETLIKVKIGMPLLKSSTETVWRCRYQLTAPDISVTHTACGADAIQALYIALRLAGVELAILPYASELSWEDMPNFGFPEVKS